MAAYLSQDLSNIIDINEHLTSQLVSKSMWIKIKEKTFNKS